MRYLRAFFTALSLTLQGKSVESSVRRYPNLQAWLIEGQILTKTTYVAAEANGINQSARKALSLRLDGRTWTMELVLSSVQFHMLTEYPSLLKSDAEHNLTTFYALNFDDQYRVSQLAAADLPLPVQTAIQSLATHLQNIPSSKNP
jgi:hypothetical protein